MPSVKRPWLHLVDGGITDNLGLRAYYEFSHIDRGIEKYFAEYTGEQVNETPTQPQTLGAMTHIQMRNYTSDTLHIVEKAYTDWENSRSAEAVQASFDFV